MMYGLFLIIRGEECSERDCSTETVTQNSQENMGEAVVV